MTYSKEMAEYKEDLEILLTEVADLLASTEENLVVLEQNPGDTALIQEVFRVMHTIKGGAATLGLQDAVSVSHSMETLFDEVRSGVRPLSRPLMDVLFSVVDWLKEWRLAMSANQGSPSADAVLEAIRSVSEARDETGDELSPRLEAAVRAGRKVQRMLVTFKADASLLSVRCFQVLTALNEAAEVVGSRPSLAEIESDHVGNTLEVFLVTEGDEERLRAVAEENPDVREVVLEKHQGALQSKDSGEAARGPLGAGPVVKRSELGKTVRVDVSLLDFLMNMVGELVIDRARLSQVASQIMQTGEMSSIGNEVTALASHLQRTSAELQEGIMRARLLPLQSIFSKFPRMMRDLSQRCGKAIAFEVSGEATEIDRTVLEAIDDPLIHVLRNAVDHGVEMPDEREAKGKSRQGRVSLSAWHEENQVLVRVEDDGAGIDGEVIRRSAVKKGLITEEQAQKLTEKESVEMVFMPGFSTSEVATEVSGRGVGMDVVRANLERVNGQIEVKTKLGQGTQVTLRLPLTLAIMRALLVRCGGDIYAVPTSSVEEVFSMEGLCVKRVQGRPAMKVRERVVPVISLEGALAGSMWGVNGQKYALLTKTNDEPLAVVVDDLLGEEEIVVKEMGRLLSRLKGIAGATILAKGDPAIILDINRVI